MAARTAVGTGNWSNPAIWDGGATLPGVGDTADSNGFTVTIDQDIAVDALINTNAGAGGFTCSTTRTIMANIVATVRDVLACGAASPVVVTVIGNITGGSSNNVDGIVKSGTGTLNVTGNITGGSGTNAQGLLVTGVGSSGPVTITGNATGGSGASVGVLGGATGAGAAVVITGDAIGGAVPLAFGASNTGTGTLTVLGKAIGNNYGPGGGSNSCPGLNGGNNASGSTRTYGIEYGPFGQSPTSGAVVLVKDATNTAKFLCSDATTRTLVVGGGTAAAGVFKGAFG